MKITKKWLLPPFAVAATVWYGLLTYRSYDYCPVDSLNKWRPERLYKRTDNGYSIEIYSINKNYDIVIAEMGREMKAKGFEMVDYQYEECVFLAQHSVAGDRVDVMRGRAMWRHVTLPESSLHSGRGWTTIVLVTGASPLEEAIGRLDLMLTHRNDVNEIITVSKPNAAPKAPNSVIGKDSSKWEVDVGESADLRYSGL